MANIHLTLAMGNSDIVRDFTSGDVRAEGIDITYLNVGAPEVFHRFLKHREFDVAELSFGMFTSLASQNDQSIVSLPVFPWRVFRLSSFYVRPDGSVKSPEDLVGKRVGVPEWAQTATIWARGWLSDCVGIDLKSIEWFQGGVDEVGRGPAGTVMPMRQMAPPASPMAGTTSAFVGPHNAIAPSSASSKIPWR